LGLLSIPLMLVGMALLFMLVISFEFDSRPVGYVDHSGLLATLSPAQAATSRPPGGVYRLPNRGRRWAALQSKQIQAYFVLDEDYLKTAQPNWFL
jgi:hypothetical protein